MTNGAIIFEYKKAAGEESSSANIEETEDRGEGTLKARCIRETAVEVFGAWGVKPFRKQGAGFWIRKVDIGQLN